MILAASYHVAVSFYLIVAFIGFTAAVGVLDEPLRILSISPRTR